MDSVDNSIAIEMNTANAPMQSPTCALPDGQTPRVQIAHGGGGRLMNNLLRDVIKAGLGDVLLDSNHDGAVLDIDASRIALTTDSYVVKPRFFPGGDIGGMAIYGTVNDLAMCGARPMFITVAFILEEGLPLEELREIVASMAAAARKASVRIVTGDTKVVERGHGDGIYINTTGAGVLESKTDIGPTSIQPGDRILVSGDIGRHGAAILAAREGLSFESEIESDCAPLAEPVLRLMAAGIEIHCLRDLTRGGLAACLVELAEATELHFHVREMDIKVRDDVRGACEFLGLDAIHLANEGRFALIAPEDACEEALRILREYPGGEFAGDVGRVLATDDESRRPGTVTMESELGTSRFVDMLAGEQLPRIC